MLLGATLEKLGKTFVDCFIEVNGGKRNNKCKICDWGMSQYFLYEAILTKICLSNSLKHL